jgi:hypothetical protein
MQNSNYIVIANVRKMLKDIVELSQIIDSKSYATFELSAKQTIIHTRKISNDEILKHIHTREQLCETLQLDQTFKDELKQLMREDLKLRIL